MHILRGHLPHGKPDYKIALSPLDPDKASRPLSGLRVVRWEAIRDWRPNARGFEIETEMNLYLVSRGWGIAEVPIEYRKRLGEKKLKIRDAIPIIKTLRKHSKCL